jgi:hypothetical protein
MVFTVPMASLENRPRYNLVRVRRGLPCRLRGAVWATCTDCRLAASSSSDSFLR